MVIALQFVFDLHLSLFYIETYSKSCNYWNICVDSLALNICFRNLTMPNSLNSTYAPIITGSFRRIETTEMTRPACF